MEAEKSHSATSSDGGFFALHSTTCTLLLAGNPEPVTCSVWRSIRPVLGATAIAAGGGVTVVPENDTGTAADTLKSSMLAAATTHLGVEVTQSTTPRDVPSVARTTSSVVNVPLTPAETKCRVLKSQSLGLKVVVTAPLHSRTATSTVVGKPAPDTRTTWPSARSVLGKTVSDGGGGGGTDGSNAIGAAPDSPPGTGAPKYAAAMARASQPLGAVTQSARPLTTLTTRRTEMLTSTFPVKSARVNCEVARSQNAGSLVGGLFTLHSCTTTFAPGVKPVARTRTS